MNSLFSRSMASAFALALIAACTSKTPDAPPSGPAGGAVSGALDSHCGTTTVTVDPSTCQKPTGDAGMPMGDAGTTTIDYGATMYNQSGADDDCKYDVSWTSTAIYRDTDATFTVTLKTRADGKPVLGAEPDSEVFLDATHAAPNVGTKTTDKGNGVYDIGPIRFDRAGQWTVRYHFFDVCIDGTTSPHGHAAFYVNVP